MLLFMGTLNISRSVFHGFCMLVTISSWFLNITGLLHLSGSCCLWITACQPNSSFFGKWTPVCHMNSHHCATVEGSLWLRVLKHISFRVISSGRKSNRIFVSYVIELDCS